MTDDMLRAVANSGGPNSKGGVVQVELLHRLPLAELARRPKGPAAGDRTRRQADLKERQSRGPRGVARRRFDKLMHELCRPHSAAATSVLIDHIDHIAKVAGVDHVGLGSDFDGVRATPEGMDSAADLPKITEALMARGYTAEDCRKILGGNLLSVFREVEQVAKELQAENRPRITEKQPFNEWQK